MIKYLIVILFVSVLISCSSKKNKGKDYEILEPVHIEDSLDENRDIMV